jgi:cysteine sulfinate desulfinase/cysteine desulfurase-like protein
MGLDMPNHRLSAEDCVTVPAIYLDNQATTAIDPLVLKAMLPYLTDVYGNPSSPHCYGRRVAEAVVVARQQVQVLIGAAYPSEIIFTSGATESNHLALTSAVAAVPKRGDHVVSTAIEHKSVLAAVGRLVRAGLDSRLLMSLLGGTVASTQMISSVRLLHTPCW